MNLVSLIYIDYINIITSVRFNFPIVAGLGDRTGYLG